MTLDTKIRDATALIRESLSDRSCVTCSFQAECMVVVDLLVAQRPDIPVLFLETGYHFRETYAYRDQMTERLRLNLINLS
jgi:phosphoadenosine phosphosulfate reductase